jgi:hypothetical protein
VLSVQGDVKEPKLGSPPSSSLTPTLGWSQLHLGLPSLDTDELTPSRLHGTTLTSHLRPPFSVCGIFLH